MASRAMDCWRRLESEPRRRCSGEPTVEPKARVLVRLPDRFERLTRMSAHNVEVAQFDDGANMQLRRNDYLLAVVKREMRLRLPRRLSELGWRSKTPSPRYFATSASPVFAGPSICSATIGPNF